MATWGSSWGEEWGDVAVEENCGTPWGSPWGSPWGYVSCRAVTLSASSVETGNLSISSPDINVAVSLQGESILFGTIEVSSVTFTLKTNVIDWTEWNKDAETSLNYWANKYDRGECLDPAPDPCSTPTTGTTGTTGTSGEPEPPTVYYCPKIEDFLMYPCSQVKMFIKGSKDAYW